MMHLAYNHGGGRIIIYTKVKIGDDFLKIRKKHWYVQCYNLTFGKC